MRFLVDECAGPALAHWLRNYKHEVFSVYDEARGLDDDSVIRRAGTENRILITNDKGFGEKVFRAGVTHAGGCYCGSKTNEEPPRSMRSAACLTATRTDSPG